MIGKVGGKNKIKIKKVSVMFEAKRGRKRDVKARNKQQKQRIKKKVKMRGRKRVKEGSKSEW